MSKKSSALNHLANNHLFLYADEPLLKYIEPFLMPVTFHKGAAIAQQGQPAKALFLIEKGFCLQTVRLPGDLLSNVNTLADGDFYGITTLLDDGINLRSLRALEQTTAYILPREYLNTLLLINPKIMYTLCRGINTAIGKELKKIYSQTEGKINDISTPLTPTSLHEFTTQKNISLEKLKAFGLESAFVLNLPYWQIFSSAEIEKILGYCELYQLPDNCSLFVAGEKSTTIYIVLHGAVQNSISANNINTKINILSPGQIAGLLALTDTPVQVINCITREQSLVLALSETALQQLAEDDAKLFYRCYHRFSQALVNALKAANKLTIRSLSEVIAADRDSMLVIR